MLLDLNQTKTEYIRIQSGVNVGPGGWKLNSTKYHPLLGSLNEDLIFVGFKENRQKIKESCSQTVLATVNALKILRFKLFLPLSVFSEKQRFQSQMEKGPSSNPALLGAYRVQIAVRKTNMFTSFPLDASEIKLSCLWSHDHLLHCHSVPNGFFVQNLVVSRPPSTRFIISNYYQGQPASYLAIKAHSQA